MCKTNSLFSIEACFYNILSSRSINIECFTNQILLSAQDWVHLSRRHVYVLKFYSASFAALSALSWKGWKSGPRGGAGITGGIAWRYPSSSATWTAIGERGSWRRGRVEIGEIATVVITADWLPARSECNFIAHTRSQIWSGSIPCWLSGARATNQFLREICSPRLKWPVVLAAKSN